MKHEIRAGAPAEVRADSDGIKVSGYAVVFNQEADIGGMFREVFKPGAFAESIERDDVLFLVNHDGLPLARTRSGTLELTEDEHGVRIDTELDPEDPDVQAVVRKLKRGDLDKMSFGFLPEKQEWDDTQEPPKRTISKARLFDVSVVNLPAYEGTEIGLRSLEKHREQVRKTANFHAARHRVRMKGHLELSERPVPEKGA